MTSEEIVQYWTKTAEYDYASMRGIFSSGEYVWALFLGHLVVEKLLEACCARTLGKDVPRTHNLLRLARLAGIELTAEQKKLFGRLNTFQIRTHYADWKNEFRRVADRAYAEKQIQRLE